jgi:hypothetical protein
MKKTKRKSNRIGFIVSDEKRSMLEELCDKSNRSMTGVIENLIHIEYRRAKESEENEVNKLVEIVKNDVNIKDDLAKLLANYIDESYGLKNGKV